MMLVFDFALNMASEADSVSFLQSTTQGPSQSQPQTTSSPGARSWPNKRI